MKIHYNKDFECYMVAECHKTDVIELDEVQLIPITELEKIKTEIKDLDLRFFDEDYRAGVARGIMEFNKILNKHITELKGE